MNIFHKLSFLSFLGGILLFLIDVLTGEVEVGFFVFIPFIIGSGLISFFGVILVIVSIFLFMYSFIHTNREYSNNTFKHGFEPNTNKKVKSGGIILIGPIPIIFGSNLRITIIMIIITILILFLIFLNFVYL